MMKFSKAKQDSIRAYILEKIGQNLPDLTAHVAEVFSINRDTAHNYINRLVDEGVIRRVKRGVYALVQTEKQYEIHAPKSESVIFSDVLQPEIAHLPPNVRLIWEYAFTEMVNNVIDHSESPVLHVTILTDDVNTSVLIADDGVGIFQKIKTHFDLPIARRCDFRAFQGQTHHRLLPPFGGRHLLHLSGHG